MPSSFTPNLGLTLPATGELSGTWGTTVNQGITELLDSAVAGTASITMTAADYTLSTTQGAANEARNMFVTLGGTPGAARNVIVPAVSKLYFVFNNTTGGFAQTVRTPSGTGVSVANGQRRVLYCDGVNVVDAINNFIPLTGGTFTGNVTAPTFIGALTGNASTATTLQTARTINGVSFNGSANITVADATKLPLTGGTLTGGLSGTTASFDAAGVSLTAANIASTGSQVNLGVGVLTVGRPFVGTNVGSNALDFGTRSANPIVFVTDSAERMRLDATGNLGIGGAPSVRLHVQGTGDTTARISTFTSGNPFLSLNAEGVNGGNIDYDRATSQLRLQNATSARTVMDTAGNVGVGITPSNRLHVGGIARVSDATNSTAAIIDSTTTAGLTNISAQFGGGQLALGVAAGEAVRIDASRGVYFPGISTTASAANAFLNSGSSPVNQLLRSTSSRRYKQDIRDLPGVKSEAVYDLRPVVYKSKAEADDASLDWYGLIAEEVAEVDPRLCHYTAVNGELMPDGVQYDRIAVLLLAELKTLRNRIADLEARLK